MRSHSACVALAVAFLGLGFLFGPPSTQADWTGVAADQQISFDDNEYARGVQLLFDDRLQLLHCLWAEDSPLDREIVYGVSTDRGATWSSTTSDRVISFPDGKDAYEEPAVTVDFNGRLLVVWSEDVVDNREVHYGVSSDGGTTFTSETADLVLSNLASTGEAGVPSAAIDMDGVMHVVWHQSNPGGAAEVHYSKSFDGGNTWTGTAADRIISFPDDNSALDPKIVIAGSRLVVTWKEDDDSGDRTLHVGLSDNQGNTWTSESADRPISQPVNLMTSNDAAATDPWNADGWIFAIYAGSFDTSSPFHYETYVTYSDDYGTTWTGETMTIPVSFDEDHTRSTSNADVFYSDCSGALIAWNEDDEGALGQTAEQHVSRFTTGGWSGATADQVISFPDEEDGYRPSITGERVPRAIVPNAEEEGGEVFDTWVAWTEFAGGSPDNYEVHLSSEAYCAASSVSGVAETKLWLAASPNPAREQVRIDYVIEQATAPARLEIFTADGRRVREIPVIARSERGEIEWDLRDADGFRVASGVYLARLSVGASRHGVPIVVY